MVLWKVCHDPYISLHPVSSPSFLPLIFNPPNHPVSVHIAVYLPTHGQDSEFIEELTSLEVCLHELHDLFPLAPVYLRGDFNVNAKNFKRVTLLDLFCKNMGLTEACLNHNTYHHFVGNGNSNSRLDKLFSSLGLIYPESVSNIICKLDNPAVSSHHDIIVSEFHLPLIEAHDAPSDNLKAPKVDNNRYKVLWSDEGVENYQQIVGPELERVQHLWFSSPNPSKTLLSLLCESTNRILTF